MTRDTMDEPWYENDDFWETMASSSSVSVDKLPCIEISLLLRECGFASVHVYENGAQIGVILCQRFLPERHKYTC
ncbi:MAG: hypothetical protein HXS46_18820 [Theionarchaea archaeon]|nr:hypothetical protein [Theionarchaea archaeon]